MKKKSNQSEMGEEDMVQVPFIKEHDNAAVVGRKAR